IRAEADAAPARTSPWSLLLGRGWLTGGLATAAMALAALLALRPSTPSPAVSARNEALVSQPAAGGDEVEVVTVASAQGATLRWDSPGTTFLVLKSSHPSSFQDAQVTVVCGSSWTDRDPSLGVS